MPTRTARSGPRRAARAAVVLGLIAGPLLVGAAPASASSLEGCSGTVTSLDADGDALDGATAADGAITDTQGANEGDGAFTADNPFAVANDGVVQYSGSTDAVITDHTWSVSMLGIEIASGGSENADGDTSSSDEYDLGSELPVKFTGLVRVEGELSGTGGACTGDGFVKFQGNPLTSPVTWAGLVFAGAGALGVFLSLPRVRPARGVQS